jgi:NADPH:quinone reductase-like Zn-dependent oxidoreductase
MVCTSYPPADHPDSFRMGCQESLLSDYDVVLDSLGGDHLARSLIVLRPGGLAISVVGPLEVAVVRTFPIECDDDFTAGSGLDPSDRRSSAISAPADPRS